MSSGSAAAPRTATRAGSVAGCRRAGFLLCLLVFCAPGAAGAAGAVSAQDAQSLFDKGDYRKAADAFLALFEATKDPIALVQAANSYDQIEAFDLSIKYYRLAIESGLDKSADVHYNLATAYYSKYRREEAIQEFERVLELTHDNDAMAHYHLGIILDGEGRHAEAIAHYQRTVEITGDREPRARQHLGVAYFLKGDYAGSVRELEIYIRQVPDDPGGYLNLAIALRYNGKLDRAIAELTEAIRISADQLPEAHYQLARIYGVKKEYEPALKHFEIALARGVRSPKTEAEYEELKRQSRKK